MGEDGTRCPTSLIPAHANHAVLPPNFGGGESGPSAREEDEVCGPSGVPKCSR